jgi:uncharacterized membrane protein
MSKPIINGELMLGIPAKCYNIRIMSKKNSNGNRRGRGREEDVREYNTLIRYTSAVVLLAGCLLTLAMFASRRPEWEDACDFTASYAIVGIGAFLLPIALIAVGIYAGFRRPILAPLTTSGLLIILVSILAFAGIFPEATFGGMAGTWIGSVLDGFFGFWGALVLLVATIAIGIAVVIDLETVESALAERALALYDRARGLRNQEGDETDGDFDDVVGVPETDEYSEEAPSDMPREERDPGDHRI